MTKIPVLQIPINGREITQGDTVPEILFSFAEADAISLTLSVIKIDLWSSCGNRILSLSSANAGITIISEKAFKINEISESLSKKFIPGFLKGDLEITTEDGKKTTYLELVFKIRKQHTL